MRYNIMKLVSFAAFNPFVLVSYRNTRNHNKLLKQNTYKNKIKNTIKNVKALLNSAKTKDRIKKLRKALKIWKQKYQIRKYRK